MNIKIDMMNTNMNKDMWRLVNANAKTEMITFHCAMENEITGFAVQLS